MSRCGAANYMTMPILCDDENNLQDGKIFVLDKSKHVKILVVNI